MIVYIYITLDLILCGLVLYRSYLKWSQMIFITPGNLSQSSQSERRKQNCTQESIEDGRQQQFSGKKKTWIVLFFSINVVCPIFMAKICAKTMDSRGVFHGSAQPPIELQAFRDQVLDAYEVVFRRRWGSGRMVIEWWSTGWFGRFSIFPSVWNSYLD